MLKNVFRCTLGARQLHYSPEKAAQIINVCAAIHNLRIKFKNPLEYEELNEPNEEVYDGANEDTAGYIRDEIMRSIV